MSTTRKLFGLGLVGLVVGLTSCKTDFYDVQVPKAIVQSIEVEEEYVPEEEQRSGPYMPEMEEKGDIFDFWFEEQAFERDDGQDVALALGLTYSLNQGRSILDLQGKSEPLQERRELPEPDLADLKRITTLYAGSDLQYSLRRDRIDIRIDPEIGYDHHFGGPFGGEWRSPFEVEYYGENREVTLSDAAKVAKYIVKNDPDSVPGGRLFNKADKTANRFMTAPFAWLLPDGWKPSMGLSLSTERIKGRVRVRSPYTTIGIDFEKVLSDRFSSDRAEDDEIAFGYVKHDF